MIILAVDPGERRIGFARCDREEMIASPHAIERIRRPEEAVAVILRVAAEVGAERLILGHARHLDGRRSVKAREAEALAARLREEGAEVILLDERLTTAEAETHLKEANLNRRERKACVDAVAAQRLLELYLCLRHDGRDPAAT